MLLTPLHLLLPNDTSISLEVSQEDTLNKVLQELLFFEMLPKEDEEGMAMAYCFLDQGSGKKLASDQIVSTLSHRENGPVYLLIDHDEESEASPEIQEVDELSASPSIDPNALIQIQLSLPSGEEVELELPLSVTGKEIIQVLEENDLLEDKRIQNGKVIRYQIESIRTRETFFQLSLLEAKVTDEERLRIIERNSIFVWVALTGENKPSEHLLEIDSSYPIHILIDLLIDRQILQAKSSKGLPYEYQFSIPSTDQVVKGYQTFDELGIEEEGRLALQVKERDTPQTEDSIVSLLIQLLPSGDTIELELLLAFSGEDIIEELIKTKVIPEFDPDGNPYSYGIIRFKGQDFTTYLQGEELLLKQQLFALGIRDEECLILKPNILADGNTGMG